MKRLDTPDVLLFSGRAYVGYVVHDQIIGISKLTRLVRVATRRFGVQERGAPVHAVDPASRTVELVDGERKINNAIMALVASQRPVDPQRLADPAIPIEDLAALTRSAGVTTR